MAAPDPERSPSLKSIHSGEEEFYGDIDQEPTGDNSDDDDDDDAEPIEPPQVTNPQSAPSFPQSLISQVASSAREGFLSIANRMVIQETTTHTTGAAGSAPQSSAGPTTESTTSAGGRLTIEEAEAAMVAYVSDQEEPAVQTPTRALVDAVDAEEEMKIYTSETEEGGPGAPGPEPMVDLRGVTQSRVVDLPIDGLTLHVGADERTDAMDLDLSPPGGTGGGTSGPEASVPGPAIALRQLPELSDDAPSWARVVYQHIHETQSIIKTVAGGHVQVLHRLDTMDQASRTAQAAVPDNVPRSKVKISFPKRKREPARVGLARVIRDVVAKLLGVHSDNRADWAWAVECPEGITQPTKQFFYFRWREPVASPFNKQALAVVEGEIAESHPHTYDLHTRIIKARIRAHWAWLHRKKRRSLLDHFLKMRYRRRRSKYQRKYNLFQRRMKTCAVSPQFAHHATFYRTLGVDGTSSDEEFDEPGHVGKSYKVTRKPWQSEEVRNLNKAVDMESEKRAREVFVRGTLPRRRVRVDEESTNTTAVPGLPKNAYSTAWISTLTAGELAELEVSPDDHMFVA